MHGIPSGRTEFVNAQLKHYTAQRGILMQQSPDHQPQSNGAAERVIGLAKAWTRRLLIASSLGFEYWPYAMKFAGDLARNRALKLPFPHPCFGEVVGIWKSGDPEVHRPVTFC